MLSVAGVVYIKETPTETKLQNCTFLKFVAIGKHPRKKEHVFYKINLLVPDDKLTRAQETIVEGKHIWIRLGELTGRQSKEGYIYNEVSTSWDRIELLALSLIPERQEEKHNE